MSRETERLFRKFLFFLQKQDPMQNESLSKKVDLLEKGTKAIFINLLPLYMIGGGILLFIFLNAQGLTELFPILLSSSGLLIILLTAATLFILSLYLLFLLPALTGLLAWKVFPHDTKNVSPSWSRFKLLPILDKYEYLIGMVLICVFILFFTFRPDDSNEKAAALFIFVSLIIVGCLRYYFTVQKTQKKKIIVLSSVSYGFVYAFSISTLTLVLWVLLSGFEGSTESIYSIDTLAKVLLVAAVGFLATVGNQALVNRYCPYPRGQIGSNSHADSWRSDVGMVITAAIALLVMGPITSESWAINVGQKSGLIVRGADYFLRGKDYPRAIVEIAGFNPKEVNADYYSIEVDRKFSFPGVAVLCPSLSAQSNNKTKCLIVSQSPLNDIWLIDHPDLKKQQKASRSR